MTGKRQWAVASEQWAAAKGRQFRSLPTAHRLLSTVNSSLPTAHCLLVQDLRVHLVRFAGSFFGVRAGPLSAAC